MKTSSKLELLLEAGHFAVTSEIGLTSNTDGNEISTIGSYLRGYVDAINLTDNKNANVQISSIASGTILENKGHSVIIHMNCRDRNRIGLQSDLLGAYALGIKNVVCVTGDHQKFGNQPNSKKVFDIDSIQLISLVRQLRDKGCFLGGEKCEKPPKFYIGAVINPFSEPIEFQIHRLEKKIKAGADFIQTQAIFDMEHFKCFMELVRAKGLHKFLKIIAGIMPLISVEEAVFVQKNFPGVIIPEWYIERLKKALDQKTEGINIIIEQINQLRSIEGVAGIHLISPMWHEIIPLIVEKSGLYPRPQVILG